MYALTRSNRRKTTKARRTQIIDVPRFLINPSISYKDITVGTKIIIEHAKRTSTEHKHPDLFIVNKSPYAGKRKFIFHARPKIK